MTTAQQYFLTVVQQQSVARAAEQLYLSQQNLSNHIKRLEQQYGVLFVRKPKFELTLAGRPSAKRCSRSGCWNRGWMHAFRRSNQSNMEFCALASIRPGHA